MILVFCADKQIGQMRDKLVRKCTMKTSFVVQSAKEKITDIERTNNKKISSIEKNKDFLFLQTCNVL